MALDDQLEIEEPGEAVMSDLVGPLSETSQEIGSFIWQIIASNIPRDLHWQFLAVTLVLAVFIWLARKGHGSRGADGRERPAPLLKFLFPRDIYTHISARVDIWLWIIERALRPLWFVGLMATVGSSAESAMISSLQWVVGASLGLEVTYGWMLLYSLVTLLCYDFIFFIIRYTMHRVPALWAVHKVHHSAEVLTPLTRYREHFLAGPIWAAGIALSYGLVGGVFTWLFGEGITAATLFNIGFFSLLFGFNGSFRHYHVQFNYPRWLSLWLHSPAMHHIHHSYLEPHWDKNFAAVTSIWDRLFGTLYIPVKDEYTPWGIGPKTQSEHRTYLQNTLGPFNDWYKMVKKGDSPQAGAVATNKPIGSVKKY
jgi:sterol desaturase/sphingolipid hydroxylase (fatty acid hydroxylase superfamily)